ncbi:MAG: hypothetical protein ACREGI_02380 [Candidatus Levyibacteriota bacterium]
MLQVENGAQTVLALQDLLYRGDGRRFAHVMGQHRDTLRRDESTESYWRIDAPDQTLLGPDTTCTPASYCGRRYIGLTS